MSIPVFPPSKEADLLAWSANFATKITATPAAYGLNAGQSTSYSALNAAFASAYATAVNPATNSKSAVAAKNLAKTNLVDGAGGASQLVAIVEAFPGTTNPMRTDLNIRIRDTSPTPVPVPTQKPDVDIISTFGTTIQVRVHGSKTSDTPGKPAGVKGASIFWAIGENQPVNEDDWTFSANTTKNVHDIVLPSTTPPGSRVWITAFWFNNRMESGPAATAVSVNVPGLGLLAA